MQIQIGTEIINSYKRLSYTPWHAIAEFVDNSTQAYFDNKAVLDEVYRENQEKLNVSIVYDRDLEGGTLRISDNSIGMSLKELTDAMKIAVPTNNGYSRSRYGMGLKTAACWLGNYWVVRTKKLGETTEHEVTVDVKKIANGNVDLNHISRNNQPLDSHYTIIEIKNHNRKFYGQTLHKIKKFLSSMYREDIRNDLLQLEWQGETLLWEDPTLLIMELEGEEYKREFNFDVNGKNVYGWAGILEKGSRASAGFSIIVSGRVIKGWPDTWRPSSLFGQFQGSNDLVNQRLIGEIHFDRFDVTHTKDDILWLDDEDEIVEKKLKESIGELAEFAKKYRKYEDERKPSETEVDVAVSEIQEELDSPEMADQIELEEIPAEEIIQFAKERIVESVKETNPIRIKAVLGSLTVSVYLVEDLSINDPYVTVESSINSEVIVIVNKQHPHWSQLKASEGVANYLRHCIYDAISEWKAMKQTSKLNPDTIKLIKDKLLRISFEIERNQ